MEHDKKPISNAIALTPPEFTVTPQWAQNLGRMAKEKYGSLSREVCEFTRYLVHEGETPLNLQDYSKIVSDLMNFGYADILGVVLAHIPPDLTKLVVTNNAFSLKIKGRKSALKTLIDVVLLNSNHVSNVKITHLDFDGFQFTEEEAELLIDGFAKTNSLEILTLTSCSFAQKHLEVYKSLLQTNKSLKSLRICSMSSLHVSLLNAFNGNKTLVHLELNGVDKGAVLLADTLKQNKTLQSLDCINCEATDQQWAAIFHGLQEHPTLKRLVVQGTSIQEEAVKAMAKMLGTVPTLTELHFWSWQGNEPLIHLKDALGHISVLTINTEISSAADTLAILTMLVKNDKSTHFQWVHPRINEASVNLLVNWIKNTTKLKRLYLGAMPERRAQAVVDAMEFNTSLDELDLTSSCDMGALSLHGLINNKHLTKLVLSGNSMNSEACVKIAPLLHSHPSITCIELDHCDIDLGGLQEICRALEGPATIRSLSLKENNFSNNEVRVFFRALNKNKGLVSLFLEQRIDNSVVQVIISAETASKYLAGHHSLINLDHRLYLTESREASKKIDLLLQRNFTAQNPVVIDYLRGFMVQFAWKTIRFGDIGNLIWKYFIKDTEDGKKDGMFATVQALRAALAIRHVMLGSAEYNPSLQAGPKATGSNDQNVLAEPDTKRQKT